MREDAIFDLPSTSRAPSRKKLKPAKENQPPVDLTALLAVGVAAVGAGLLHRLHSQGKKLQQAKSDLESKSSQLSEVTDELHSTQEALQATTEQLQAKVAELERQQAALEEAMGELGATRSRISVIERELMSTRRSIVSYQGQLERARYEMQAVQIGYD